MAAKWKKEPAEDKSPVIRVGDLVEGRITGPVILITGVCKDEIDFFEGVVIVPGASGTTLLGQYRNKWLIWDFKEYAGSVTLTQ